MGGICWRTMPGPLSLTVTRKRVAWLAGGAAPLLEATSTVTTTSGRMPASSAASRALSTASFTQVRSALRGLSKPKRWRFLVKNSETEISRWRAPISAAETEALGAAAGAGAFARAVAISLRDTKSERSRPLFLCRGPAPSMAGRQSPWHNQRVESSTRLAILSPRVAVVRNHPEGYVAAFAVATGLAVLAVTRTRGRRWPGWIALGISGLLLIAGAWFNFVAAQVPD